MRAALLRGRAFPQRAVPAAGAVAGRVRAGEGVGKEAPSVTTLPKDFRVPERVADPRDAVEQDGFPDPRSGDACHEGRVCQGCQRRRPKSDERGEFCLRPGVTPSPAAASPGSVP
jgi:hypothetical protein